MKKIFALALAAVMTAGMTTVAFADAGDQFPVIGVKGTSDYNRAFVLDDEDVAAYGLDPNVILEGGDKIVIPISVAVEGANGSVTHLLGSIVLMTLRPAM